MRTFPPDSPQAAALALQRVLETIQGINACLPTASGVQAATAGLINACTTQPLAESVLALQLKAAICYLNSISTGTIFDQTIPEDGIDFTLNVGPDYDADLYTVDAFAKSFTFPNLVTVGGSLYFATLPKHNTPNDNADGNMSYLLSIDLPLLTSVLGITVCTGNPVIQRFSAPLLQVAQLGIDMGNNIANAALGQTGFLTDVNLDSLTSSVGNISLANNINLVDFTLPSLVNFGGLGFSARGCALSEDSVNSLFITLANLNAPFNPIGFINMDAGTNAPPTGAGLAAALALAGTGIIVTYN